MNWQKVKSDPVLRERHRQACRARYVRRKAALEANPELKAAHKKRQKVALAKFGALRRKRFLDWFATEVMASKCCFVCGIENPVVLEWHHRDPKLKRFEISKGHMYSRASVLAEIAKCECLCANCHRIRHWEERGGENGR